MPAVLGIISLAVDFGRVQMAKGQLQDACDAAARYAASGASDGTYLTKAQAVATQNTFDGQSLSLSAAEVSVGNWANSTFTANGTPNNAVRVMLTRTFNLKFAPLIGRNTCNVYVTSIAKMASSTPTIGIVGLNSMNLNGSPTFDSYDSSAGAYGGSNVSSQANLASNGNWNLSGTIKGNINYRGSQPNNGTVTGSRILMGSNLSYATPTTPASYTNWGNQNLNSGNSITLTAGNHYFQSLSNNGGTINVNATGGVVKIYVNGAFSMGSSATINVTNNLPSNFEINMVCSAGVDINTTNPIYATINAPSSPLNLGTNAKFYGTAITSQIGTNSGVLVHQDVSGGGSGGSGTISLVK